jgi:hypothetical protein
MPARLSPPWTPPPNLLVENTWIVSRITHMILRYLYEWVLAKEDLLSMYLNLRRTHKFRNLHAHK